MNCAVSFFLIADATPLCATSRSHGVVTPGVSASLRYASKAHWGQLSKALREVYTAPTVEAAHTRFGDVEAVWGERYPAVIRLWDNDGTVPKNNGAFRVGSPASWP